MEALLYYLFGFLLLALPAAGLYLLFELLRRYALPMVNGRRRQAHWRRRLLQAEIGSWSVYLALLIYQQAIVAPWPVAALLAVLLLLSWAWWRDFIPGLLFRLDQDVSPGDVLYQDRQRYTVELVRARSLRLRSEDGSLLILPYRLLKDTRLAKAAQKTALSSFTLQLSTDKSEQEVAQALQDCPWMSPAYPPKLQPLENGRFQILTFAPDEQVRDKQLQYLRKRLN